MHKSNIFIKKANIVHNKKYSYELVEYINNKTDVIITCPKHGNFKQKPHIHLDKSGCKKCGLESRIEKTTNNTNSFIKRAIEIHKNKYTYESTNYTKALEKIIITCPKHEKFKQKPNSHLLGRGCPVCAKENRWVNYGDILLRFKKIHGDRYLYDELTYNGSVNNMDIFCKKHEMWFTQSPHSHLKGYGCPSCSNSIGENTIKLWLQEKNIKFITNKKFSDCKNIKPLPFDFYLPNNNILIEFDGEQHYKPKNFGGISKERAFKKFENQKNRDKIKNDFTKNQKIKLIRISYLDNPYEKLNTNIL